MSQRTQQGRGRDGAEDDVPPVPRQQVPRVPEDDIPDVPDERLPELARDEVPERPDPSLPPVEPHGDEGPHPS